MNLQLFSLISRFKCLLSDDRGQDLVEYALVVAIIALGATTAMTTLSSDINGIFTAIGTTLSSAP